MKRESWMPKHKSGEEAAAEKHDGASTEILRGEQQLPFAKGDIGGVVAQEKVAVTHEGKKRERDFVIKYFRDAAGQQGLESSMEAFELLKEAGVKHIPVTYRKIAPKEILMTDYNRDDKVALGNNANEKGDGLSIKEITNLSELMVSVEEDIICATKANIRISADCYFFIVPKSGGTVGVDFVIGDFGNIHKGWGHIQRVWSGTDLYVANVISAGDAIRQFIFYHVVKKQIPKYTQQVREWVIACSDKPDTDALANEAMDRGS